MVSLVNKMKKYFIELDYLYEFDGNNVGKFCQSYTEIVEFENIKALKKDMRERIKSNIADSKDWYNEIIKKFDSVERGIAIDKNDLNEHMFYMFEKFGYKEDFGYEAIVRVTATPITKKNAIDFVGVT